MYPLGYDQLRVSNDLGNVDNGLLQRSLCLQLLGLEGYFQSIVLLENQRNENELKIRNKIQKQIVYPFISTPRSTAKLIMSKPQFLLEVLLSEMLDNGKRYRTRFSSSCNHHPLKQTLKFLNKLRGFFKTV